MRKPGDTRAAVMLVICGIVVFTAMEPTSNPVAPGTSAVITTVPAIVPVSSKTLLVKTTAVPVGGIVKSTVLDVVDPTENCTAGSSVAPTPLEMNRSVREPGMDCKGAADTVSVISGCWVGFTAVGTVLAKAKDPKEVATTDIEKDLLAVLLELSRTSAVNTKLPAMLGLPASVPVGDSVKPGGNAAAIADQVYGASPPVAVKVREYGAPTVPAGRGAGVTIERGTLIVSARACVAVLEPLSATLTVKFDAPAFVGVPLMTPVDANAKPAGNDPVVRAHV